MGCQLSVKMRKPESFQNAVMLHSVAANRAGNRTKVIVLGTSNSGKSTLLRQFQIINTTGFTSAERKSFIPLIVDNILKSLEFVLQKAVLSRTVLDAANVQTAKNEFLKLYSESRCTDVKLNGKLLRLAVIIWESATIRDLFDEYKDEFESGDSLICLFDSIERISAADYTPTNQDILYCRMRSTGIKTLNFDFDDIPLQIIDVGGQRSERRKWIHYFENVEAVIFCVSANEYNSPLREDPSKNALVESLEMFESIINSAWFMQKPIILFLNKIDLLEQKIKQSCILDYFSDFSGDPRQFAEVSNFIKSKFLQCNRQQDRPIFAFNTCATDTSNIQRVSKICFHMVFTKTLSEIGL